MVKVKIFLFVVSFVWMLFDVVHGDVQIFNEGNDGNGPKNISVNIQGSNGGNICIDCQNQIQIDSSMEDDNPQRSFGDMQPYLDTIAGIPPIFYAQSPVDPSTLVVSENLGSEFQPPNILIEATTEVSQE